jgi:hypothetical protein
VKMPQREKLLPLTEQMKAWSAALAAELRDWPQVTQKSFFGFTALYRGRLMFGLLPRTRSVFKGNAVAFRLECGNRSAQALLRKDSRIAAFDKDKARWFTFQILADSDLHEALHFLGRAFEAAGNRRKSK